MPLAQNPLDKLSTDLAEWVDQISTQIADGLRGGLAAPGAARLNQSQLLEYYTHQFFNPDGSTNMEGRAHEMARLGPVRFAEAMHDVLDAHPEWKQQVLPPLPPPTPAAPMIPAMAQGGIVTQPTVALIGEAGPEAVVPLTPTPQESLARIGQGASEDIPGQLVPGNVNLNTRPIVRNQDGTISTVRSISFEDDDGREVLIPTVSDDGRVLSNRDAIAQYYASGRHLGIFTTPDAATAYALRLHQQQADQYGGAYPPGAR
jgi:hypothetical protein